MIAIRVDDSLDNCARCGKSHTSITFQPLDRSCGEFTHWAPCPTNGQPIMMCIIKDPDPDPED